MPLQYLKSRLRALLVEHHVPTEPDLIDDLAVFVTEIANEVVQDAYRERSPDTLPESAA